ncbi:beta-ketoacyl-ACP synthase II [Singulisphaera acidiphila]|uniref:3-oxoacyl-[acyl-carrier-protein] synthase 2 n=1 Tax=Singulisphaera acidiphila (strain ATCC BAA-1392 / DSM 18658 / VKM B-2454 / MOB10) TaxID=886293 RepID=L0D923_SINAD|nr:beta-ketoacyl-ACP synthase II [Singulisphaera acidiphila]AGA25747.1 beta-ketoacyl-acyl-carrier-protein synthase II [Singulisphaera acidiphila DSM 18658]
MGKSRRVVITGMGVVTALGDTLDRFWSSLCAGQSGVGPLSLFDTSEFKVHFGGQVPDWDPVARFGVKEARHLDRFAQFAMAASMSAVEDSGIDFERYPSHTCGVIIGSGIGGLTEFETQHSIMREKGPSRISPFTIPKLMVNAASGQVSIRWGLCGPNTAIATACASAANAIGDAFKLIQAGLADVMITGGSEAAITHMGLGGFASMRALSTRNEDPTRASRPFDRDRDGFVLSEGAGIMLLECEEVARARGARIYAEVLGYGMSADGSHITAPDEQGRGAARAMNLCLNDARVSPDGVDYINAHGTSTGLGDLAETRAMKSVFGSHVDRLQISSTKSELGHLLGASGGVELIASALAIHTDVLPPTINLDNPGEGCDLDYIPNVAREVKVERVMSNSFGFGGHNASLLIGRYRPSDA